jgi:hypothetical protein
MPPDPRGFPAVQPLLGAECLISLSSSFAPGHGDITIVGRVYGMRGDRLDRHAPPPAEPYTAVPAASRQTAPSDQIGLFRVVS